MYKTDSFIKVELVESLPQEFNLFFEFSVRLRLFWLLESAYLDSIIKYHDVLVDSFKCASLPAMLLGHSFRNKDILGLSSARILLFNLIILLLRVKLMC